MFSDIDEDFEQLSSTKKSRKGSHRSSNSSPVSNQSISFYRDNPHGEDFEGLSDEDLASIAPTTESPTSYSMQKTPPNIEKQPHVPPADFLPLSSFVTGLPIGAEGIQFLEDLEDSFEMSPSTDEDEEGMNTEDLKDGCDDEDDSYYNLDSITEEPFVKWEEYRSKVNPPYGCTLDPLLTNPSYKPKKSKGIEFMYDLIGKVSEKNKKDAALFHNLMDMAEQHEKRLKEKVEKDDEKRRQKVGNYDFNQDFDQNIYKDHVILKFWLPQFHVKYSPRKREYRPILIKDEEKKKEIFEDFT